MTGADPFNRQPLFENGGGIKKEPMGSFFIATYFFA